MNDSGRILRQALAAMIVSLQAQDSGDNNLAKLARDQAALFLRRAAVLERPHAELVANCGARQ